MVEWGRVECPSTGIEVLRREQVAPSAKMTLMLLVDSMNGGRRQQRTELSF